MSTFEIHLISETALCCTLPPPASLDNQRRLWALADILTDWPQVAETVTGMNNLTVFAKPDVALEELAAELLRIWPQAGAVPHQGRHVDISVVYGGEYGVDLAAVAAFHDISVAEVVRRHTEPVYTVFMMGFQPGFPYLGGLPEHLHTPRHAVPRTQVAAGSVGIGGSQTGVYPFASPGGWQLIGHTDTPLFQTAAYPPTLLQAGDTVRFVAERIEP